MNTNFKFLQKQIDNLCFLYLQKLNFSGIMHKKVSNTIKKYIENKIWIVDQEIIWQQIFEKWETRYAFYKYYSSIIFWDSMNNNLLKKLLSQNIEKSIWNCINSYFLNNCQSSDFSLLKTIDFRNYRMIDFSIHSWMYDNIYSYMMLYNFKKEQLLSFLEKNLLLFLTLKIIFDLISKEVIISEKNNYYMTFWKKVLFKQCKNILWKIYDDLELRIWKENLDYCYNYMLSSLQTYYNEWLSNACNQIARSLSNQTDKFAWELITLKEKIISWDMFYTYFCTYIDKIEKLEMINKLMNIEFLQERLRKNFDKDCKIYFKEEYFKEDSKFNEKMYNGQIKQFFEVYWFDYLIRFSKNPFDILSYKYNEYKKVKEEISKYFKHMIDIFEWWIKWSLVEKFLEKHFDETLFSQNLANSSTLVNIPMADIFRNLWFNLEVEQSLFTKENTKQEYLDLLKIDSNTTLFDLNHQLLDSFDRVIFRYLSQKYYLIELFEYILDDNNKDSYIHRMFLCYIKKELRWFTKDMQDNFFKKVMIKCDILSAYIEQNYYDIYIDQEDKDKMLEILDELKNTCMELKNQITQLIQKYS